jgi:hypothetical protein
MSDEVLTVPQELRGSIPWLFGVFPRLRQSCLTIPAGGVASIKECFALQQGWIRHLSLQFEGIALSASKNEKNTSIKVIDSGFIGTGQSIRPQPCRPIDDSLKPQFK